MPTDDDYYSDIHPPNVVLVSSNPTSPGVDYPGQSSSSLNGGTGERGSAGHGHGHGICSPLSTAPNSPGRSISYDEEDDDDTEDEEIRPEEIAELLQIPPSPTFGFRGLKAGRTAGRGEVPFDEGNYNNPTTTTADSSRLPPQQYQYTATNPSIAIVSPASVTSSPPPDEDIDAYVDEEEHDDLINHHPPENNSEEKKLDDANDSTSPPSPSVYFNYLTNFTGSIHSNSGADELDHEHGPEDESVPDDERIIPDFRRSTTDQQQEDITNTTTIGAEEGATDNANTTNIDSTTPKTKALQTAEREVQEMERRVQQMLEQRRQTSQRIQKRVDSESDVHADPPLIAHNDIKEELDGEPPSLSPQGKRSFNKKNRNVNSSLDSGCSSYYYDGSVLGSIGSSTNTSGRILDGLNTSGIEDHQQDMAMNNTTINTTTTAYSELAALQKTNPGTARDLAHDYYAQLEGTRESVRGASFDVAPPPLPIDASKSSTFEDFTARFDHEAQNGSFAKAISGTSRAFHQVTEDVANFLVIPTTSSSEQQQSSTTTRANTNKHPYDQQGQLSPVSQSHDSDCTPQLGNLSPKPVSRRHLSSSVGATQDNPIRTEKFQQKRSSYNVERARSLVQSRLSPPTVDGDGLIASSGSKQRARQVMDKREREQQLQTSVPLESSSRAANNASRDQDKGNSSMNLPGPPSLFRIAALVEGFGGSNACNTSASANVSTERAAGGEEDMGWPGSVSQLMEEYQDAISESLRNLSMDEIAGLAQNGGEQQKQKVRSSAAGTMVSPGVSLSPSRPSSSDNLRDYADPSHDGYDDMIAEMTMGACLKMPQLDHSPHVSSRSTSNARTGNAYSGGAPAVSQYDADDMEFQYHQDGNDQFRCGVFDDDGSEHEERNAFATQLSERLHNLGPNCSTTDTSGSFTKASPEKSFMGTISSSNSKDSSSIMSPPTRRNPAYTNIDSLTNIAEAADGGGGLFASNLQQGKCLPSSEQPSVCSNGFSPARESNATGRAGQPTLASNLNTSTGSSGSALTKPTMVESIDNETGIAKGDVMLSLLCDNSFQASKEKPDSWAWRVREAMWRSRDMRKQMFGDFDAEDPIDDEDFANLRASRRTSLPVDVDDVRVVGGIKNVASIQEKALVHLKQNEFEQALELYEDIIFNYYSFFEKVLATRDEFSSEDVTKELSNFKPYIGASLHNLGVIHLLKGDYEEAFSFFKRAVDNRRACLGEDSPDCITSLVRLATCRFAMDNFADAHTNLEMALALAGSKARTTNDYCQLGEILNNLGCLSYMSGQPTKAMKLFRESLDVQLAVLNSTLYGGSKFSAHSATLSISITRGNIGFLALVLKDVSSGILALESALREQRLLLKGAHVTLVSTMDHLAVANLLEGRTQKAIKMLRRIYELQRIAHGPNDPRCTATKHKILTIRGQQIQASKDSSFDQKQRQSPPRQGRVSAKARPKPAPQKPQSSVAGAVEMVLNADKTASKHLRRPSESSGSRCTGSNGNISNPSGGNTAGKSKNSMFKAIRSLGRSKKN